MRYLVLLMFPFTLLSQDLWKESQNNQKRLLDEHRKNVEEIFYNKDFREASKGVDLSKVNLNPSKAIANTYNVKLSDRDRVIEEVNKYKGVPYLWGGDDPNAFDCSGLVQWTIKKTHGKTIPRTTATQYAKWGRVMKSNLNEARPGDFIYFKTRNINQPVTHVGIYIGNNQFIHAPKKNDVVRISHINEYGKTYRGYVSLNTIIN